MKHDTYQRPDGFYHRFDTGLGVVWAVVYPGRAASATVAVYEDAAARASVGLDDDEAMERGEAVAARNRFGTGVMLRVLRAVRDATPSVRRWFYERKSGANVGRLAERTC